MQDEKVSYSVVTGPEFAMLFLHVVYVCFIRKLFIVLGSPV